MAKLNTYYTVPPTVDDILFGTDNTIPSRTRNFTVAGLFALYNTTYPVTIPTLQTVTNSGSITTNTITVTSVDNSLQGIIQNGYISSIDYPGGTWAKLYSDGFLGLNYGAAESYLLPGNTSIQLFFPNKPAGTYTIATTADIPTIPLVALPFTTDHLTATNNQYVVGNVVWYLGNIYRCIANNDSIVPTSTLYWTNLGAGYPLIQQSTDWNSTSGNNQILNKPTIPTATSDLTNDGEDGVNPFITLADVPANGLPAGGTAGQVLTKIDSANYNAQWLDEAPAASYTSTIKHKVKLGLAIAKGQAVYVSSADGTNMVVSKASNTSESTSSKTMGLLETGGNTNAQVNVVTEGLLAGLNTAGQTAGDPVWLGTAGNLIYGLTNKPYAPAHLVFIGIVTRVNSNNGEIFVKIQNGFELKEIHDVDLITTTPINGHLLGYNGTLWVNKTIATWLGYTPANKAGDTFTGNIEAPSMSLNGVNLESLMIAYAVALG